jgi:pimeloyl-ACP methyl ester carboxylesterase
MNTSLTHQMVPTNGTELHTVTSGDGFPVVLLHGFPQTWYEWRHLIPLLNKRFRLIAPDLRGIGDSIPHNTGQDKRTLATDILGLLDVLGIERAVVVGHDWGGGVAQRFALDYPTRIERLICIDIPYFPAMPPFPERPWMPEQLVHSWYIFFHLNPELPERIAEAAGESYIRWFFEHGSGVDSNPFSIEDVAEYARWFTQPGRATAAFNLYRTYATVDVDHWLADRERVLDVATMWLHGMQDPFVRATTLTLLSPAFINLRIERLEECGHWVPEEAPDKTAALIYDFLQDLA